MTTTGSVTAVGGNLQIDGQSYDVGTAIMMLQIERADNLDAQLADQVNEMKQRNEELRTLNQLLADLRGKRPADQDGKASVDGTAKYTIPGQDGQYTAAQVMSMYGITNKSGGNQAEWDQMIESLKGKIESMNSTSQLDMIRLQSITNKRNQAYELMTNMIQKFSGTLDKVIGNMR